MPNIWVCIILYVLLCIVILALFMGFSFYCIFPWYLSIEDTYVGNIRIYGQYLSREKEGC